MRIFILFILSIFLFSCGTNQFAKRHYTKGVYVAKRSHGKIQKTKNKEQKYKVALAKVDPQKVDNKKQKKSVVKEEKIEKPLVADSETDFKENPISISDKVVNEANHEILNEELNNEHPPELNDGEVLRKTKKADRLGLASGIMGYTALGVFLLSLLILFILWIVFYVGVISWTLSLIIFYFMFFGSMALGLAALVTGAISYSRGENGLALAGIIIGAIFALILLIALIAIFV